MIGVFLLGNWSNPLNVCCLEIEQSGILRIFSLFKKEVLAVRSHYTGPNPNPNSKSQHYS